MSLGRIGEGACGEIPGENLDMEQDCSALVLVGLVGRHGQEEHYDRRAGLEMLWAVDLAVHSL